MSSVEELLHGGCGAAVSVRGSANPPITV
jgi:hypothetical protein